MLFRTYKKALDKILCDTAGMPEHFDDLRMKVEEVWDNCVLGDPVYINLLSDDFKKELNIRCWQYTASRRVHYSVKLRWANFVREMFRTITLD